MEIGLEEEHSLFTRTVLEWGLGRFDITLARNAPHRKPSAVFVAVAPCDHLREKGNYGSN